MEPASIQSKLKELANLLMKEDLEKEDIETARKIASKIDSDTVNEDKRKMKEEFLRLTFGYDINTEDLSSLPTMVDGIFYLRGMVSVYGVKEIVENCPQVFGLSIDNLNSKVEYIESLGVNNVGKVVKKCPQVLELSIDNLNSKVEYLESLGVDNVGKVVEKFPQVFGLSIDNLNSKVEYLESLGVDNVGKVVEKHPSVLGYSIDKMNENVEYLESLGVDNVGKVVEKHPQVLGLSIDKMNRKLSYYQIYFPTVEFIKNEPVHLLEKDPRLLGRSLYLKIIPRLRYVSSKIGGDIKKYGLNIFGLMYPSDKKFISRLQEKGIAADKEEYSKLLDHYKQIDKLNK
jgi:hypothetical protein